MVILGVLVIGGFAVGGSIANRRPRQLDRAERLRLDRAEATLDKLYDSACDERELGTGGNPFADIVIDEIRSFRKNTRKELGS
jgi:hypothetical protein